MLDCPSRLSTACINGLASSDFALIPVMLDKLSSVSAPNLLRKLKDLRFKKILPQLSILGVIANRVEFYNARPIKAQAAEWDDLIIPCREAWGQEVHFFETKIKQSGAFARAAEKETFAALSDEFKKVFIDLFGEMEERIAHESGRGATVSA
jgi:cellulose biosynthesis protein BcsQ